jgi:putative transposase
MRLKELAGVRVRYGCRRLHVLLQREDWQVNVKRVYRRYRLEGLSLRLKTKRRERAQYVSRSPAFGQLLRVGQWISSQTAWSMG